MILQSDYLNTYFDEKRRKSVLRHAKKTLKDMDFDVIAVVGVSGLLWGTAIATNLGKKLCVVRKNDGSHSKYKVEGHIPHRNRTNWIIVDDFISSGTTVEYIIRAINNEVNRSSDNLLGVYEAHFKRFKNSGCLRELLKVNI
jgi:orotate phosphoribosyltransferase